MNSDVATDTNSGTVPQDLHEHVVRQGEVSGYNRRALSQSEIKGIESSCAVGERDHQLAQVLRPAVVGWRRHLDGRQDDLQPLDGTDHYTLGATNNTWGRTWAAADFGSGFRVRPPRRPPR